MAEVTSRLVPVVGGQNLAILISIIIIIIVDVVDADGSLWAGPRL